jgi:serine/threonine protein kinase
MAKIKLEQEWEYNPKDKNRKFGSFGEVYFGTDISRSQKVAIKKLRFSFDDAGHREIDIAVELRGKTFQHVIPILDSVICPPKNWPKQSETIWIK